MFWFSLGVFIGQNEELLLQSHLAKTYRIRDLKIEFQSSFYIFSGRCLFVQSSGRSIQNGIENVRTLDILVNCSGQQSDILCYLRFCLLFWLLWCDATADDRLLFQFKIQRTSSHL